MGRNHDPVTLHKYLYANADPVRYVDPTGKFSMVEASITNNIVGVLSSMKIDNAFNVFDVMGLEDPDIELARNINLALGLANLGAAGVKLAQLGSKFLKNACSNSFDGATLVSTEDGLIDISEVKIGDLVWAFDEESGDKKLQQVVHLIQREGTKQLVELTTSTGDVLKTTMGHTFYLPNTKSWVRAINLSAGDLLVDIKDNLLEIASVKSYQQPQKVYNLTVDNDHTYYVGQSSVLSHNISCISAKELLERQLKSQQIGHGHAYEKHVVSQGQFPSVTTQKQFSEHIENVIASPTHSKNLGGGRKAYYDQNSGTIVITNPADPDGGTAFKETLEYFNNQS